MSDKDWLTADALEFSPDIVKAQRAMPSRYRRYVLYALLVFLAVMIVWAIFGRLDVVAVANGKLVPQTYLKVVQPLDGGVVKEILVKEGDVVHAGQVLMRMDASVSASDRKVIGTDYQLKQLQLRRIDAELQNTALAQKAGDDPALFAQVDGQYRAHRQAYQDAVDTERAVLAKAQQDLQSSIEMESKLKQTLPIYQEQEKGWDQLAKEGFAGKLMALDRKRSRIETEQELQAQTHNVASLKASIDEANKRIAQITSNYRQQLHNERIDAESQTNKLAEDLAKNTYRSGLLELKASQAGRVKDLSTHTQGTVVQAGAVLVSADASDNKENQNSENQNSEGAKDNAQPGALAYRALVELKSPTLEAQGSSFHLSPGMQVSAEIVLGTRTILEYLLSPVQKTVYEAARER